MRNQKPDSGALFAAKSKKHEKSPDYSGNICINVQDLTKVERGPDGTLVFRINGWKRKMESGDVYLSLSIDRWVPKSESKPESKPTRRDDFPDEDIPF